MKGKITYFLSLGENSELSKYKGEKRHTHTHTHTHIYIYKIASPKKLCMKR